MTEMDEEELTKYYFPLTQEKLGIYFTQISGYYLLHENDKVSQITKIKRCAAELKLDPSNLAHLNFIIGVFLQNFCSSDESRKAFDDLIADQINQKNQIPSDINQKNQFGQEIQ